MPSVSVVVPLFNESGNLGILYESLKDIMEKSGVADCELIFVDDGSSDNTFEIIRTLHLADRRVSGISLSRNFGHQVALFAGIESARGDLVITMDGDMQHPPEVIPRLIEMHKQGYDIVNTKRTYPPGTGIFKKSSSRMFYGLLNFLSDVRIEPSSGDFRLMNRKAADAFLRFPERARFTRGLVSWMGFRQAMVGYVANPRHSGKSGYSLKKMIGLGLDGITSFTSKPLRISLLFGTVIFLMGILYAAWAVYQHFTGQTVPGWTSILVSVLIIGGIQLLSLGLIGLYLARVFNESKKRPVYLIGEAIPQQP